MQDLQLIGVHEDGDHLLLGGPEGTRFRMLVDEPLRAALRHDRPRLGQTPAVVEGGLRPREVQALIRAGASAEEAADRAGWSVDKVHRYEGPILAEREHVAGLARTARLRARSGASNGSSNTGGAPTLAERVSERLKGRGVDPAETSWDSCRAENGPWTVVLTFAAGGRQRQASWSFDLADRTVAAVDDEARWLSEEEQVSKGPIPAPHLASASIRTTKVYDLEAEGGLRTAAPRAHRGDPPVSHHDEQGDDPRDDQRDEPIDLMTAMRERTTARSRRKPGGRRGSPKAPTNVPAAGDHAPDQALPLEDLAYDPETMPPPPAAHADPDPSGADGRPEPESAAYLMEFADAALADTRPAEPGNGKLAEQGNGKLADDEVRSNTSGTPEAQPARRKSPRKGGRPNVPAWDEIMFGSRPGVDRSST